MLAERAHRYTQTHVELALVRLDIFLSIYKKEHLLKLKLIVTLLLSLALTGCAAFQAPVKVHPIESADRPSFVEVDATRRGVLVVPRPDGHGYYVCSEPSPDVALTYVNKILAEIKANNPNVDAKTQLEFSTAVIDLSKRSQTILFLREVMFRLCEQSINQQLPPEQVSRLYEMAVQTALKMAEAELAKNQADLAKRLQDPAVRELWNQLIEPTR